MAKKFDPYQKWFNIPAGERPPDHYQLLGIERFESNAQRIDDAVEQRVAFLHDVATGPHVAITQRILNEVAAARLCLTDPDKKAAYDAELRQPSTPKKTPKRTEKAIPVASIVPSPAPPKTMPQAAPVAPPPVKTQDEFSLVPAGQAGKTAAKSQFAYRPAKKNQHVWLAAGGGIVALVLVVAIVVIAASSDKDSQAKNEDENARESPVATRNIHGRAKRETNLDRRSTDLARASEQPAATEPGQQRPTSTLPTGSFDGTGTPPAWSFGSGGLSDPRVSTNGLVLWLDAAEASTVSSAISVRRWSDKSGKGNDAVPSPNIQSPKHRDRLVNGKPAMEFEPGQRLTVKHKPQLNLGANYTLAFVAGGEGTLFAKGNVFSDGQAKAIALQPNLSRLRFSKEHDFPADDDNPRELNVRIVVADQRSVRWFIGGRLVGEYEGPHEINNNAALQIGRFHPEKPQTGFHGKLAEFLIYNRPIGDDQRQKIEEYLSEKWLK